MAICRKCGKEIRFIKLKSGKYNPVDPQKRTIIQSSGPETLITDAGDIIRGTFCSIEGGANGCGYISHFATCPAAEEFRSGRT
jgi:hypothetical protein